MSRFLVRISLFAVFLLSFLLGTLWLLCQTEQQMMRLPEDRHTVFFGNSHIETSVNDSLMHGVFNFGRSADRLEWIYTKIKLLKKYNPQFKRVVIGFDNVLPFHKLDADITALNHPYTYYTYDLEDYAYLLSHASSTYIFSMFCHPLGWQRLVDLRHFALIH